MLNTGTFAGLVIRGFSRELVLHILEGRIVGGFVQEGEDIFETATPRYG